MGHGGVAVDVFFIMSGFVLHRTYGPRLQDGWSFREFARARFVRLYPLYLAGLLVGLGVMLAYAVRSGWDQPIPGLLRAFATESLLIPDLSDAEGQVFPLNAPYWSLLIEAIVSLGYGMNRGRVSPGGLCLIIGAAALVLTVAALNGLSPISGGQAATLWMNLCRGIFGFSVGVAIAELDRRAGLRVISRCPVLLSIGLLGAIVIVPGGQSSQMFELSAILVASPVIVCVGVAGRLPLGLQSWCRMSGALSYPLYTVHAPVLFWIAQTCLSDSRPAGANLAIMLAATGACTALALAVGLRFEPRLTRALKSVIA